LIAVIQKQASLDEIAEVLDLLRKKALKQDPLIGEVEPYWSRIQIRLQQT